MKRLISIFLLINYLLVSCSTESISKKNEMPSSYKDAKAFSFYIVWGAYGYSSYDSSTGKLVKTIDATNPEDYVATLFLKDNELEIIYNLIYDLNPYSYSDEYNPFVGVASLPSQDLCLTINCDDKSKSILCKDIAISKKAQNKKGQKYLDTCNEIIQMIISTDEYKALPDFEFLYI